VWLDIWRNKINDENISFGLKCGINTGFALVGYIPTKERDEFIAVGSRVNLASRLEKRLQAIRYLYHQIQKKEFSLDLSQKQKRLDLEEIKAFEYICEYYEVIGKFAV
jgi:hypothetical protein